MSWELVVLVLGFAAIGAIVYGINSLRAPHGDVELLKREVARLSEAAETSLALAKRFNADLEGVEQRVKKLEETFKLDGQRIMTHAAKAALPGFMR